MRNKIKHGDTRDPMPKDGRWMTAEEMTPGSLYLREGQEFTAYEHDPVTRNTRKRSIKITKLYKHHALCKVNGRHMECFTYNELYTLKAGGSSA